MNYLKDLINFYKKLMNYNYSHCLAYNCILNLHKCYFINMNISYYLIRTINEEISYLDNILENDNNNDISKHYKNILIKRINILKNHYLYNSTLSNRISYNRTSYNRISYNRPFYFITTGSNYINEFRNKIKIFENKYYKLLNKYRIYDIGLDTIKIILKNNDVDINSGIIYNKNLICNNNKKYKNNEDIISIIFKLYNTNGIKYFKELEPSLLLMEIAFKYDMVNIVEWLYLQKIILDKDSLEKCLKYKSKKCFEYLYNKNIIKLDYTLVHKILIDYNIREKKILEIIARDFKLTSDKINKYIKIGEGYILIDNNYELNNKQISDIITKSYYIDESIKKKIIDNPDIIDNVLNPVKYTYGRDIKDIEYYITTTKQLEMACYYLPYKKIKYIIEEKNIIPSEECLEKSLETNNIHVIEYLLKIGIYPNKYCFTITQSSSMMNKLIKYIPNDFGKEHNINLFSQLKNNNKNDYNLEINDNNNDNNNNDNNDNNKEKLLKKNNINYIDLDNNFDSFDKRNKRVITKKIKKFWKDENIKEASFIDIRKKYYNYLREKKLCFKEGVKINKKTSKILKIDEGYVENYNVDKVVEKFFI